MSDLEKLINVAKSRPRERRLVCPQCRNDIELDAGVYVCKLWPNEHRFASLRELAVVP